MRGRQRRPSVEREDRDKNEVGSEKGTEDKGHGSNTLEKARNILPRASWGIMAP
jgi:hypothetical protein